MVEFLQKGLTKDILINRYQTYGLNSYWSGNEYDLNEVYGIFIDKKEVGLLDLSLGKMRNGRPYGRVEMIELYPNCRGIGLGKVIVKSIFSSFKIESLFGEALPDAIMFWYSIGADFEMSYNKLLDYIDNWYSAAFKLTKYQFDKVFKK